MSQQQRALIIGASKGIGLAVVQQLLQAGWQVTATYRSTAASFQHPQLQWLALDITDGAQRDALVRQLGDAPFDCILINAGILGPHASQLRDVDDAQLSELFFTNAVAPVRLAESLLPLLRDKQSVLGLTTSRLASLNENRDAAMPFYSASKAALNMLSRALATQMHQQGSTLLSLHPGWVKTDMGGEGADITVTESAQGMVTQLQQFSGRGGHHYVDYRGQLLNW
ncbi:SDR family oxidoreductase [Pantoea dispersa]|uniref:SDR family oxidoreductase n=1 Tax=Pantoea dispersa TaxID=59814 RepID=UPI0021C8F77F|nr:SDR family oxidoreductase [Pantoea dispersa]UXO69307.1 SDR family oxidoreductase [Pantoea dispersa]